MIKEPNAREVHAVEFIAGLDQQLVFNEKFLEERLKEAGLWRWYRIAMSAVEKVIDGLYATLPQKTMKHMQRLNECGEIVIRPKGAIKYDDVQIVQTDDLRVLINTALMGECVMCVKDRAEQKGCKFRKSMARIVPANKLPKDGTCPYLDVVVRGKYGEYI